MCYIFFYSVVGETLISFQDVVFLVFQAYFYITFLKKLGDGERLTTLILWLGLIKGMLPVKYL